MRCRPAVWLACAVMACAALAQAQSPATVRGPWRLDEGTTATVQDVYLAASNPSVVSAAWITSDGFAPGIYLRNRSPYGIWQPIKQIKGEVGSQPRDLAMAHDYIARLYMVWTALDGGRRQLHFARSDTPAVVTPATLLTFSDSAQTEAQFPAIAEVPGFGMTLVWQSESTTSTSIRAAVIPERGPVMDLGVVSGDSRSAMAPQIISTSPLRVAWYQIDEIGGRVAVNEWAGGRWQTAKVESLAGSLPQNGYVMLRAEADTLAAGWQEPDPTGIGKVALEVLGKPAAPETSRRVMFETPPGEHTQPSMDGSPLGRLTIAWRNCDATGQEICMRSIDAQGRQSENIVLSPASQRFAGRVDQVTIGNWSVAAWTDVARDGGRGGVYVSELNWQTPASK